MNLRHLLVIPAALLLVGCPSTYEKTVRNYMWTNPQADNAAVWKYDAKQAAYVHTQSGFIFPDKLGDFTRHKLTVYDAAGRDVSAGYDIIGNISVTIYVYPVGKQVEARIKGPQGLVDWHVKAVEDEIVKHHQGAVLKSEAPSQLVAGTDSLPGRIALFRFTDMGVPLGSSLHLYLWGQNFVSLEPPTEFRKRTIRSRYLGNS